MVCQFYVIKIDAFMILNCITGNFSDILFDTGKLFILNFDASACFGFKIYNFLICFGY